jgi:hypothetical protein
MSGRVDKEQTAVHSGIGDMPVPLSSELLPQIARVLIFDLQHREQASTTVRGTKSFAEQLTYRVMGSQHPSLLI